MNIAIKYIPVVLMALVAVLTFNSNLVVAGIAIAAAAISLIPRGGKEE